MGWVLHNIDDEPIFNSVGKVAGVHTIYVVDEVPDENKKGLLSIIATSVILMFVGIIVLSVFIVLPYSIIVDTIDSKKRQKIINAFKSHGSYDPTLAGLDYILDLYKKRGKGRLLRYREYFENSELQNRYQPIILASRTLDSLLFSGLDASITERSDHPSSQTRLDLTRLRLIEEMLKENFIRIENNEFKDDGKDATIALAEFVIGRDL